MQVNFDEFRRINNLPKREIRLLLQCQVVLIHLSLRVSLKNAGYEVIGISMKLYEASSKKSPKTCCSGLIYATQET